MLSLFLIGFIGLVLILGWSLGNHSLIGVYCLQKAYVPILLRHAVNTSMCSTMASDVNGFTNAVVTWML